MCYGPLLFKYFHAVHLCFTAAEMLLVAIREKMTMYSNIVWIQQGNNIIKNMNLYCSLMTTEVFIGRDNARIIY